MCNVPFFFINKFGISDTVAKRRKNVSETTPGLVLTVLSLRMAFGLEVEQFVHRLYRLQNVRFWTGSGRTEWFVTFSPVVGASVLYVNSRFGLELDYKVLVGAFLTPFVWLDGLFWLLAFWMLKALLVLALSAAFVYAVANMS
jgi:hypothetical protein